MTNWQQDAAEKALSSTLSRTVDFLKFAETKNAALLTFSSAWMLALANFAANDRITDRWSQIAVTIALLLFALAALVALYSFLPQLRLDRFFLRPDRSGSLLYFADIAEFEPATFIERFRHRYANGPQQGMSDAYLDDLAVQVAVNSRITRAKFKVFNIGATIVMAAIMVLGLRAAFVVYSHLA